MLICFHERFVHFCCTRIEESGKSFRSKMRLLREVAVREARGKRLMWRILSNSPNFPCKIDCYKPAKRAMKPMNDRGFVCLVVCLTFEDLSHELGRKISKIVAL